MLKHLSFALAAAVALAATVAPARAQVFTSMEDLVQIEVIQGGMDAQGAYVTALRLTLAEGWKTYWRVPGEAGIAPRFDWKGSRNIGDIAISWPTPDVFVLYGLQSIGYSNELVLPLAVTPARPGQAVRLRGEMEIGMCKDVCIPGTLAFDQTLDPDAASNPAIEAALERQPLSGQQAGVRSATCKLSPADGGMRLTARITMPSAGAPEEAVIEPGSSMIWASPAQTSRRGNVLTISSDLAHVSQPSFALDRSQVRITVLGKRRAVDIQGCTAG